jgi:hypothetical protein
VKVLSSLLVPILIGPTARNNDEIDSDR